MHIARFSSALVAGILLASPVVGGTTGIRPTAAVAVDPAVHGGLTRTASLGGASDPTVSVAALQAAADAIIAARAVLAETGVTIQHVARDAANDRLIVGVAPGASPEAMVGLQQRFPAVPITIEYVRVLSAAESGEYTAGPPWVTGMELYTLFSQSGREYYTECTAGFNVIDPSTGRTYLTTAAHCFDTGDTVLHSTGAGGQHVGTVTASSGFGSAADVELITPAVNSTPNTILVDNSTRLPVSTYRPVTAVGTSLCKSGITTGQTCGNVVTSASVTVCYSGGCFHNQEQTHNASLAKVAYYGDSGGPVYLYDDTGSVSAAGSVSGFEETCNATGSECRPNGVMFFTPIRNMRQTLGVLP